MSSSVHTGKRVRCARCQDLVTPPSRLTLRLVAGAAWAVVVGLFALTGAFAPISLVMLAPILLAAGCLVSAAHTQLDEPPRCPSCGSRLVAAA